MCLSTFPPEPDFENFIVVFVKDYADGVGQNGGAAQKYISAIHTMQYGGPPAAAMQASQVQQFIQDFYARSARSRFSVDVDTGAMVDYGRVGGGGGGAATQRSAPPPPGARGGGGGARGGMGAMNGGSSGGARQVAPPPPGRGGGGGRTMGGVARPGPPASAAAASRGPPPPPPAPAKRSPPAAVAMYDVSGEP